MPNSANKSDKIIAADVNENFVIITSKKVIKLGNLESILSAAEERQFDSI